MTHEDFMSSLRAGGFAEPVTVQREPDGFLDTHAHPFEARALILSGELSICTQTTDCHYGPGDVFHLAADTPHTERYGPEGVTYLVGRKQDQAG